MDENSNKKEFPPFKPIAYFGGNLLLTGLSYIMLRQYKRFFGLLGITLVTSFFFPEINFLIILISAVDAQNIAKKLKAKQISEPPYNKTLTMIAYGIWSLIIIFFIISFISIFFNLAYLF